MSYQTIFDALRGKFGLHVMFGLLFASVAFAAVMMTEDRFQSTTDFLVVQANAGNTDFYTQFKSAEYLGKVLGEAVYSESFINAVIGTGKAAPELLPFDKRDRLESWQKRVGVEKNLELGVITVTVSGQSDREVSGIMEGITEVLKNQNSLFRGGAPESVEVRILSGPIVERTPTAERLILVIASAFIAGFLLSLVYYTVRQFGRSMRPTSLGWK